MKNKWYKTEAPTDHYLIVSNRNENMKSSGIHETAEENDAMKRKPEKQKGVYIIFGKVWHEKNVSKFG